ncbi:MAG TPA: threonine--tRNA ligase, partial [Acidobacteriota bacterium]|nr:threonine--tRNA ligase [Acidobacteriota bacterium]
MTTIEVRLPDGSVKSIESGITAIDFIKQHIGEGLARAALAVSLNDQLVDLTTPLTSNCSFNVHTYKDQKGKEVYWHSSAHVMAIAVTRLFPNTKLTIGPAIEDGFYYDFQTEKTFSPEDIAKIEEEMYNVIKEDKPFVREPISAQDARKLFANNPFKIELIEEFAKEDSQLTVYRTGDFVDLCRGPHIPSTGKIKAIKITKISGAYWRGKAENPQLQRVYGISFTSKDDLKLYIERLEQARARDHRKLAKEHNLVMFHEYAPGMPFFLTKGTVIYNTLVDFIRNEYRKRGYQEVITPQMFNKRLWETSGHWEHYKDDMFILNVDNMEASLKPMNCPSHCLIYQNSAKSYRDLPLRIADFCNLHRNELSGALSGLTRVRKFSQDDAHIFCTMEQIES